MTNEKQTTKPFDSAPFDPTQDRQGKQQDSSDVKPDEQNSKERKPLRQPGGIYYHSASIISNKNVFVTNEYADILVNALKMAELKKDIKNLAYVIMPNFFCWIFKLSEGQDNPVAIYSEVKKQVAVEILNNLRDELKAEKPYEMVEPFKSNERVGRSSPQKILWTFEEQAKQFEKNKRYRVWSPKYEIRLLDAPELIQKKLERIRKIPMSDRWQLAKNVEDYPYLYIAEELADLGSEKEEIEVFSGLLNQEPVAVPA